MDVPIQDRPQQLHIYIISNLPVPHGDVSARYEINNKYIGITYDETQAVMITEQHYSTCLHANGQLCKIDALFQALTNPLTCISALYTNNGQQIEAQCSLSVCTPHTTCILTHSDHIKHMDPYFNTHYAGISHRNNMS